MRKVAAEKTVSNKKTRSDSPYARNTGNAPFKKYAEKNGKDRRGDFSENRETYDRKSGTPSIKKPRNTFSSGSDERRSAKKFTDAPTNDSRFKRKPGSTNLSGESRKSSYGGNKTGRDSEFGGKPQGNRFKRTPESTPYNSKSRTPKERERDYTKKGTSSLNNRNRKAHDSFEKDSSSYGNRKTYIKKTQSDRTLKDQGKKNVRSRNKEETPSNFKGRGKQLRETAGMMEKGANLANEAVRLNRFIAMSGSYSRREADAFIQEGRVSINGETVTELGTRVQPGDTVKLDGQRIAAQKPVYILLNKPKGYVTTTEDPEGRQTVMDLIQLPAADNLFPVGRLDRNTTGVLLITNDGDLAQKIMHPSFNIKKIYRVKLDKKPSREHMLEWIAGVDLEDGRMSFEQVGFVEKEEPTVLGVEIHSGRNRVVRRMFEHFGYEVKSLDRVLLGEFDKLNLGRGRWRFLNDKEMRYVLKIKARKQKTGRKQF